MKAVVIDDEKSVRETTVSMIEAICPEVSILGEASSVKSGKELIDKVNPDLVFLDIEMQDGTGFDLLNRFPNRTFKFIFITGHDAFAIKAFRFSAIDYLLKPLDPNDLTNAIGKVKQQAVVTNTELEQFQENAKLPSQDQKIVLHEAENIHLVPINQILRCKAEINYTRFFLLDGSELLISNTLKEYDTMLNDAGFFRSHQSHLINLQHFKKYEKKDGGCAVLQNGDRVPVSSRRKDNLIQALKSF